MQVRGSRLYRWVIPRECHDALHPVVVEIISFQVKVIRVIEENGKSCNNTADVLCVRNIRLPNRRRHCTVAKFNYNMSAIQWICHHPLE